MAMLIGILDKKIKELKDLRQREERRDNKAAQDALDQKFKVLTGQIHQLMAALQYSKDNMGFQLSDEVLVNLEALLSEQKGVVRLGYADKDVVSKVETDLKAIQGNIKKEWSKKYTALTSSTIGTLKVIAGIDTEKVSVCLEGIAKRETWAANINELQTMNKSLTDAESLIEGLGLDSQIIAFLQKMNSGKAVVTDLDDKVLNWLRTEGLDKKVKLSFIAATGKKY